MSVVRVQYVHQFQMYDGFSIICLAVVALEAPQVNVSGDEKGQRDTMDHNMWHPDAYCYVSPATKANMMSLFPTYGH